MAAGQDGCLPELDYFPCCKVVCLWCMCFCCWGVFPVLTLSSPRSIVWGLFFFSSPSLCYAVFFFNSLSSCPVIYVVYIWTGWWLYISLLIIPCIIYYVINKGTLNLEMCVITVLRSGHMCALKWWILVSELWIFKHVFVCIIWIDWFIDWFIDWLVSIYLSVH